MIRDTGITYQQRNLGDMPAATAEDVEMAVDAACKALKRGDWSKASGALRAKYLCIIAAKI